MASLRFCRCLAPALLWLLAGLPAAAESDLVLPTPDSFGSIDAGTYDEKGIRVGDAAMRVTQLPGGLVELEGRSGIQGAEQTVVVARLQPTEGKDGLRPIFQSSRSLDASGHPLGQLTVDHTAGEVVCYPPNGDIDQAQHMALPPGDRVANVPLNLLFLPLVRGEVERVDFQFVLCRFGTRLINASARVAGRSRVSAVDGEELIEVRYDFDLGPVLSRLAQPFLPRLSVWFDPTDPEAWVGHRMPLFSKGPIVVVMRSGFDPESLGLGP